MRLPCFLPASVSLHYSEQVCALKWKEPFIRVERFVHWSATIQIAAGRNGYD